MSYHIYRYTMVVIGCLITASAINLFYIPNMLLSGGITGLGFLIYYLTGLPIGMMNIVLNIPLFYLAWKYMDKEYFFGSLASMTFLSLAIDALHFLTAYTPDVPENAQLHYRRRYVRHRHGHCLPRRRRHRRHGYCRRHY